MAKKVDATNGNLIKLIFAYTIPLALTTILQSLFNTADKAVLGNMAGSIAVASVGATGTVISLIINGAVGLSTGTAIILARYVGQKNEKKIRQTIDTSVITSLVFGLIVAVAGFFLTPIFLTATNCPKDCYDGAMIYMRMYLAGAPATLLYNYGSAILRTLGDTRKPLFYITVAGIVNVVLNVILCFILPQKVIAVAIATVVSKVISAALVLRELCNIDDSIKVRLKSLQFNFFTFTQMLRFGVPSSISQLVLPLGNLQIVSTINSYGVHAVAGVSASTSVNGVATAFSAGFGAATTTFIGQNIGAKNPERVKRSFWYILAFNFLISGAIGAFTYLTGRFWLGLIVGMSSKAAIEFGMKRALYVSLFMFIHATNNTLSHSLQAFGYPFLTSITNIFFNLGFRVLWMQLVYPLDPQFNTIMLCFTVSWTLNMIFYAIFFTPIYIRYSKKGICKKI